MPNPIGEVWNAIDNTDPQKQRAEHTAHLNRTKAFFCHSNCPIVGNSRYPPLVWGQRTRAGIIEDKLQQQISSTSLPRKEKGNLWDSRLWTLLDLQLLHLGKEEEKHWSPSLTVCFTGQGQEVSQHLEIYIGYDTGCCSTGGNCFEFFKSQTSEQRGNSLCSTSVQQSDLPGSKYNLKVQAVEEKYITTNKEIATWTSPWGNRTNSVFPVWAGLALHCRWTQTSTKGCAVHFQS